LDFLFRTVHGSKITSNYKKALTRKNVIYATHIYTHTHTRARARARVCVCVCVCVYILKDKV